MAKRVTKEDFVVIEDFDDNSKRSFDEVVREAMTPVLVDILINGQGLKE